MNETWPSRTRKMKVPEGKVYILIAEVDDKPYYVDIRVSREGGSALQAGANATAILVGASLRRGTEIGKLKQWLRGIAVVSEDRVRSGEFDAISVADALGRTLEEWYL